MSLSPLQRGIFDSPWFARAERLASPQGRLPVRRGPVANSRKPRLIIFHSNKLKKRAQLQTSKPSTRGMPLFPPASTRGPA